MAQGTEPLETPTTDEPVVDPDIETPVEEPVAAEPDDTPSPWDDEGLLGQLRQYDPHLLLKNTERFTQTNEENLAKQRALEDKYEPYRQLEDLINSDPRRAELVVRALTDPLDEEDAATIALRKANQLESTLQSERDLRDLEKYVQENDYPFSEDEIDVLRRFQQQRGIPNLIDAYNASHVEEIAQARADKIVSDIKKSGKAGAVNEPKGSGKANKTFSREEVRSMDRNTLAENWPAILAQYGKK